MECHLYQISAWLGGGVGHFFLNLLYSLKLSRGGEETMCWIPSKRRKFEVRSFYKALSHPTGSSFPSKSIWRNKAPLNVAYFVWMNALGNVLTLDNLRKRHVIVMNWCYMCKKSGEFIDHLLLHCKVARDTWVSVFRLIGREWVMPQRVEELLVSWRCQFGSHCNIEVWRMVSLLNVIYLEGTQCVKFWRSWEFGDWVKS